MMLVVHKPRPLWRCRMRSFLCPQLLPRPARVCATQSRTRTNPKPEMRVSRTPVWCAMLPLWRTSCRFSSAFLSASAFSLASSASLALAAASFFLSSSSCSFLSFSSRALASAIARLRSYGWMERFKINS